jgi:hypothetical protein
MRIYTYHPGYNPTLHPYMGALPEVLILSGQPGNATYIAVYPDSSVIERYGSEEMRRAMRFGARLPVR